MGMIHLHVSEHLGHNMYKRLSRAVVGEATCVRTNGQAQASMEGRDGRCFPGER